MNTARLAQPDCVGPDQVAILVTHLRQAHPCAHQAHDWMLSDSVRAHVQHACGGVKALRRWGECLLECRSGRGEKPHPQCAWTGVSRNCGAEGIDRDRRQAQPACQIVRQSFGRLARVGMHHA